MRNDHKEEPVRQTGSKEDVDDLIFCAGPDWTASQR